MKLLTLGLSGLAAIVASAVLVAPALGTDSSGADARLEALSSRGGLSRDLIRAMLATARFHSVQQAEAAGYEPASPCIASPAGGMGIHYEHPGLMADPAVEVTRPEILVYEPGPGGHLQLVALEYFRRAADQEPPFDESDRQTLFGQPFEGIMPGHAPWHGWHYDLHVWVWKHNPSGLFAAFNPRVSCP